ncbi:SUMF1/EgtB/PvdO family nonheme iron enzyme [Altererythrobacter indicus]|uniref:SUMF1/EgtB/PvdO family nonheme iron enzyme n=1 Tax=Altericroceibacterium indicum TaxID=374177 RepID=A0A845A8X0_9SPHN|nr:formylglycine-generating enzyme family protein [Altericroceibacterium indicum]MXP26690.1 SUMF1/EgtB/PvdO family nonheme iron enzyme [Altericroceibacterium indicum]
MICIPAGTFTMGSERFYPEEKPLRRVSVSAFAIDETPVTNRAFAAFVEATGHMTFAEIAPDPRDYPGMSPDMAIPGSLVFKKTETPVDTSNPYLWWEFRFGANWRYPLGPEQTIEDLDLWDHPVVHVTYSDALAYAKWVKKDLPTEAEYEYAARGGLEGAEYAWGDELQPDGKMLANYWQGVFPYSNTLDDGWERTSPVGTYDANGYGVYDMIGNTWEWTKDWWTENPRPMTKKKAGACCTIKDPRGGLMKESFDSAQPEVKIGRRVLKGGSHLCAANYCQRYRPAARHAQMVDSSTSHIGFRCVVR